MWQKARELKTGYELWVTDYGEHTLTGQRLMSDGTWVNEDSRILTGYNSHIIDQQGRQFAVSATNVELLPEFRDSVEFVPWTEFLAQCQAASDRKRKDDD